MERDENPLEWQTVFEVVARKWAAARDPMRWRRGFAWLPKTMGGETIWLRGFWWRPYGDYTAVSFDQERPDR